MSPLPRTPIDPDALAADARRALAAPPIRLMAARGLVPVARPRDLLSLFYQLALDDDEAVRAAAQASARSLPDPILRSGLGDPETDSRVLDFFAAELVGHPGATEAIIGNPGAADETVAAIAARASAPEIDLIATNETRLLRAPAIVAAMYHNRAARMSTVDRVVELAVRNGVKVSGIPAWDEICKVFAPGSREHEAAAPGADGAGADAIFARAVRVNQGRDASGEIGTPTAADAKDVAALTVPMKIRLATIGNAFDRAILIRDAKKVVALAAIKSPGVTDAEAAKYAALSALPEEVIGYIANRREWTKLYSVKVSLVNNPKCPVGQAMRLLPHLREKEVDALARSRGIPSALAAQAKKLAQQRASGRK